MGFVSAGEAYLLKLWKHASGGPMLIAFSMRSLAKVIAPFMFVPFVSSNTEYVTKDTVFSPNYNKLHRNKSQFLQYGLVNHSFTQNTFHYEGNIYYAYLICGILVFIVACILVLINICSRDIKVQISTMSPEKVPYEQLQNYSHVTKSFSIFVTISMFIFAFALNMTSFASEDYMFSISISKILNFSLQEAEILISVQFISVMISRLISIIILKFCKVSGFMNTVLIFSSICSIIMACFGLYGHISFWITTILYLIALSPVCPLLSSYILCFYPVNGLFIGILSVGYGLGMVMANWITGVVFEFHGSRGVLIEIMIISFICPVISISAYIYWLKRRNLEEIKKDISSHPLFNSDNESD